MDPDHDRGSVRPDLDPNCLQSLSADDKSCRKKVVIIRIKSKVLRSIMIRGYQPNDPLSGINFKKKCISECYCDVIKISPVLLNRFMCNIISLSFSK